MDKIMNEIRKKNLIEYYNSMYEKYKKESICLNMDEYKSENHFRFIPEGYHLKGTILNTVCRGVKNDPKIFDFLKTKDCKIIIDSISEYTMFKWLIYMLKTDIKLWEKSHLKIELSSDVIKEKAIVEILKKEIQFAKKNLKFEKGWFTKWDRY